MQGEFGEVPTNKSKSKFVDSFFTSSFSKAFMIPSKRPIDKEVFVIVIVGLVGDRKPWALPMTVTSRNRRTGRIIVVVVQH